MRNASLPQGFQKPKCKKLPWYKKIVTTQQFRRDFIKSVQSSICIVIKLIIITKKPKNRIILLAESNAMWNQGYSKCIFLNLVC